MNMLKKGIKFTPTQPNINLIKEKLIQTKSFIKPIKIEELVGEIQMLTDRNFKNILAEYNLLDKYYNFYNLQIKELAIDWCEMNCLKYYEL